MKNYKFPNTKLLAVVSFLLSSALQLQAQMPSVRVAQPPSAPEATADDNSFWLYYIVLPVLMLALGGAVVWWMKSKKSVDLNKKGDKFDKNAWESEAVDAEKELEWFRKNKKVMGKKDGKYPKTLPKTSRVLQKKAVIQPVYEEVSIDKDELTEKLKKLQFVQLPISIFAGLKPSKPFEQLPVSNDPDLMSAVEQVQDELEEDEQVRDLALRILAAFKTKNSVESLGQIALYDISSNLRSRAVSTLTDFDHESVFESLLLACADTTREVRAAAARGLFRLSFDRAEAWTRIVETDDEFRIKQAARAAIEADFVDRSFDRLTHEDMKMSYEAIALTTLIIKSGETGKVFSAIENHPDHNVKIALLKILEVTKDEATLPQLFDLLESSALSEELKNKVDGAIKSFELVPA